MKKLIPLAFTLLFFSGGILLSQTRYNRSSSAYIQTCYQKNTCFSLSQKGFVYYDANKEQLSFTIDFATFRLGEDSLDEWLDDLSDTKLTFTAELNNYQLPSLSNHASKSYKLKGNLTLNDKTVMHTAEVTLFEISEQNMDFQSSQNNEFEKLRIHLAISFLPKEYGIDKKPHHLKKTIFINIGSGYINYLRQ